MNYVNTYYFKKAVLFILPESLSLPHHPFVLSVWTWFLMSVCGSCLSKHDSQTKHQTLMPYVVMTAMPGASWMMFPTRNYSSCQGMEEAGTGLATDQWVSVPEASWKSTWLLGGEATDWRRSWGGSMSPWPVSQKGEELKQLHGSGEDGLRSGRGRKESVSVPGDSPVGRWTRCESQWIRNPLNWAVLLELNCVLSDKSQLSYMPCVKWRRLGKMAWNIQLENVLGITVFVTAPDSINAHI